jgi:hypothetical protein
VHVTKADLHLVWNETAARFEVAPAERSPSEAERVLENRRPLADRVEQRLTERAATFEPGELRAVLLEQSVGDLSPREALAFTATMIAERRVLPLEGGLMTTLTVRAREEAIERRFTVLAEGTGRDLGESARTIASYELAERIGGRSQTNRPTLLRSSPAASAARSLSAPPGPARAW